MDCNYMWSFKIYPKDVAEFLASASSLDILHEDNNNKEDDVIKEDDVTNTFVVECDDDDKTYI